MAYVSVTATSVLTSAECKRHTSSVRPWSGVPKVHLHYAFLGSLCHALAASILLKTINVDAATIKQWAILDSGATSHFLTTNAPATNIVPAAMPRLIVCLPNGDKVQLTHTCTLD